MYAPINVISDAMFYIDASFCLKAWYVWLEQASHVCDGLDRLVFMSVRKVNYALTVKPCKSRYKRTYSERYVFSLVCLINL